MPRLFSHLRRGLCAAALVALAACAKAPPPALDLAPPSFHDAPVIALDVGEVRIEDARESLGGEGRVEEYFPTTPMEGLNIWTRDRLRAASASQGVLVVAVRAADVTRVDLQLKDGVKGALTREPSERYAARLDVEMKIYRPDRLLPEAHVEVAVAMTRELLEGAAPTTRDAFYASLTRDLLRAFDRAAEERMNQYFVSYMRDARR